MSRITVPSILRDIASTLVPYRDNSKLIDLSVDRLEMAADELEKVPAIYGEPPMRLAKDGAAAKDRLKAVYDWLAPYLGEDETIDFAIGLVGVAHEMIRDCGKLNA